MKLGVKIGLGVVVVLVAMQVVRPERSNPPVTADLQAPPEVKSVLKRACYDCHSNETVWPWYSNVAPVSWLVGNHVRDGRKHLNFSEWGTYEPGRQAHKLEEVEEEVASGGMPEDSYTWVHGDAKLSEADKQALIAWAKQC